MRTELEKAVPTDDRSDVDTALQHTGGIPMWIRVALGAVALAASLVGSYPHVGVTVDSAEYLAVAEGLGSGDGYTMPYLSYDEPYAVDRAALDERVDLSHFPPAYPTLLAATDLVLPGGVTTAARWSSAICFALTTIALTSLCRRRTAAVLTTLGLLSVDLLTIHAMAWSEPLLLTSMSVALLFAVRYSANRRGSDLAFLCLAVATASGARFIGTAVGLGIGVGLVAYSFRLLRPAVLVVAASMVPTILWFVRNTFVLGSASERAISWHPPGDGDFKDVVETLGDWTIGDWTIGDRAIGAGPWSLLLLLPAALLFLALRSDRRGPQGSVRVRIGLAGAAVYLVVLVVSQALVDAAIPFDIRLFAPAHVFLLVALAAVIDAVPIGSSQLRRVAVGLVGASLLLGAVAGVDAAVALSGTEDSGYSARRWHDSEGIAFVDGLSHGTTVVTNAPDAIWHLTGREELLFLPLRTSLYTGGPNHDYGTQLDALAATIRDRPDAVVVFFDRPTRSRSRTISSFVTEELDLVMVEDFSDATVFAVRPN